MDEIIDAIKELLRRTWKRVDRGAYKHQGGGTPVLTIYHSLVENPRDDRGDHVQKIQLLFQDSNVLIMCIDTLRSTTINLADPTSLEEIDEVVKDLIHTQKDEDAPQYQNKLKWADGRWLQEKNHG